MARRTWSLRLFEALLPVAAVLLAFAIGAVLVLGVIAALYFVFW